MSRASRGGFPKDYGRAKPYNALPKLPPPVELESRAVLKRALGASRLLAELKGALTTIPNPVLLLNGIVLQEARLSSEIENIVTTHDALYRAAGDERGADPHTKEVLRYREALWYGYNRLASRPISTNVLVDLVEIIKQRSMGVRRIPGTQLRNNRGEVVYTPPVGEALLRSLLSDLERFIHARDDVDPLVKAAVLHYQFEAIHPFTDGNGRTGRIATVLYLVEQGLLDMPIMYLSHHILRTRQDYYRGLQRVTEEGAWEDWILYMLTAVEDTARQTRDRVLRIRDLMQETQETARDRCGKAYSKDLVELIFENPYSKIAFVERAGIAKRQTASQYLKAFEAAGLLRGEKVGREVYYVNDRLIAALLD